MHKKRIIAVLVVKNGIVVQSINFRKYLPVGKPEIAVEFLNKWGIDEIILLDIDATRLGPNFDLIKRVSEKCFVPLTVGGGINNIEHMRKLIRFGADKISLNTAAIKCPDLIKQGAEVLGDQCIVVSIDAKKNDKGDYKVFINSGMNPTNINAVDLARKVEKLGAGEILINSIDRDGSKKGYEIDLVRQVAEAVNIPVIACGGVGNPNHFLEGLIKGRASAVAAGNYFHFTEHSPIITKAFLKGHSKLGIRIDTYAKYEGFDFENKGRVEKRHDKYLEKIRFEYEPEEII